MRCDEYLTLRNCTNHHECGNESMVFTVGQPGIHICHDCTIEVFAKLCAEACHGGPLFRFDYINRWDRRFRECFQKAKEEAERETGTVKQSFNASEMAEDIKETACINAKLAMNLAQSVDDPEEEKSRTCNCSAH